MRRTEASPIDPGDLTIAPANEATWADLTAIFVRPTAAGATASGSGPEGGLNTLFFRPNRGVFTDQDRRKKECSWDQATDEQRRARLREQTNCDDPEATSTTG